MLSLTETFFKGLRIFRKAKTKKYITSDTGSTLYATPWSSLFLLFLIPLMIFGHGRQGLFGLLDHAHRRNLFRWQLILFSLRIHERGSVLGQFSALYFVCGGFDRELVLYFF